MTLKKGKVEKSKDEMPFKEDSVPTAGPKKPSVKEEKSPEEFNPQALLNAMAEMQKSNASMQKTIDNLKSKDLEDDDIDWEDDWLEDPAVFFCFSSWKGLYSERRKGKVTIPPNGPIKFESLYRYKKRHGNTWKVISVSQFTSRSKVEVKWLENHSEYRFGFFPNLDEAKGVDASFAQKQLEQHNIISRMSDHAVIERAGVEGIAIKTGDVDELRRELTSILADKAMTADKDMTADRLKRNRAENPELRSIPGNLQSSEPAKDSQRGENVY